MNSFQKGDTLRCVRDSTYSYGPNVYEGLFYTYERPGVLGRVVVKGMGGYSFCEDAFEPVDNGQTL